MKKAVVCILLMLVISTLTLSSTSGASSATEDVKILNYTYRFDSTGILIVVGEVQNIGQNVISTVIISGTATPTYGSDVVSGDLAWANNLLPGEKAPFYIQFTSNLTSTGAWTGGLSDVTVRVIQASTTTQYQYQGVKITSHEPSQSSNGYTIEGELKNTGSETATNVAVVATFYNSEGKPIAAGYSTKVATMAPNGINSFSLSAINLDQTTDSNNQISTYSLMVQVEEPLLSGSLPAAQTPVTGPSDSQTPTDPANNLSPVYIAVFVVAIVVVIAVWLLIKRRKSTDISPRGKHSSSKRIHNKKRRRR